MPGRNFSSEKYRYSINGQEKTPEIFEGSTTALYWEYDSRTGRRWNVDPVTQESISSYSVFDLNPFLCSDPNGDTADDWIKKKNSDGSYSYTWDKKVTKKEETPSGYEYVGSMGSYYTSETCEITLWRGGAWSECGYPAGSSPYYNPPNEPANIPTTPGSEPVKPQEQTYVGLPGSNSVQSNTLENIRNGPFAAAGFLLYNTIGQGERGAALGGAVDGVIASFAGGGVPGTSGVLSRPSEPFQSGNGSNINNNEVKAGLNIIVKSKPTWNESQINEAKAKLNFLSDGKSVITRNPVARDLNLRSKFIKAGGQIGPNQALDHKRDLQLGGSNALNNLGGLNTSVNSSLGKQIQFSTRNLPDNTKINRFYLAIPYK